MNVGLMLSSDAIDQLATALSAAQGELQDADRTSENPHLKSKYADLAEILQTARPVLSKFGLSVAQGVAFDEGKVHVTTRLMHKSGQYLESTVAIPVPKSDAQGVGAATTYGRKYGFTAMVGMSQDDDDGESIKSSQPVKRRPTETGTSTQTQVLGPISLAMIARFNAVKVDADMNALVEEYGSLTPVEQTQVLPAAKAARARLEGVKTTQPQ